MGLTPHASTRLPRPQSPQVGASVSKSALAEVAQRLLGEARAKFHQKKFEEALHLFQQCLALAQKTCAQEDHAEYGALMHNIGSCLHCLGDFATAKVHYENALAAFQKGARPSRVWMALYGSVDSRRCAYVRERLVDIEFNRKPDLDKFLDGWGYKREATPDLAEPPPTLQQQRRHRELQMAMIGPAAVGMYAGGAGGFQGFSNRALGAGT